MKKKNALESKRPLLFTAGLMLAVSLALVSFEWRTPYEPAAQLTICINEGEPFWVPVTLREAEPKKEKPAPPEKKRLVTSINPVDELNEQTDEEFELPSKETLPEFEDKIGVLPETEAPDENFGPLKYAGEMPEYCGGEKAMFDFLGDELNYPDIPRQNGVTGTVFVEFVVGKDGKLRDAKVKRPVDPWLDAEALRVAKKLDCFTPGKQGGKNVDVYFVLPIRFTLGG